MPLLDVLTYPHPLLKQVSRPAQWNCSETKELVESLIETLESYPGCVGLAAPQTGNMVRIIVIDASRNRKPVENQGLLVLINPKLEATGADEIAREGCLSLPDFTANVKRASSIRFQATNQTGEPVSGQCSGFEARVLQHEYDHLDGLLFLDRVASLKTDIFRRKRYHLPQGADANSLAGVSPLEL